MYTKSKAADFSNNLSEGQLHEEIVGSSITTPLLRVDRVGDVVNIVFDNTLSEGEVTTLNTLISSHEPNNDGITEIFTINPRKSSYESASYEKLGAFHYRGSLKDGTIKKVIITGNKDIQVTNYTIRIYDKTNQQEIGSVTGTNNEEEGLEISSITNIPTTPAMFEIQGKRTGGTGSTKKYYVETVQFYI